MSNTSLDMLASYTTPVQTQQPQTERPSEGTEITPGQKRKRADGPPQTPKENSPSIPPRQRNPSDNTPPSNVPLPAYNFPRYNREQSAPPPPSPTSEALKRRKLQNQAQANPNEQQPTGEQEMAVDDESTRPTEQANTPTPATGRRWYDEPQDNQQRPQQRNSGPSPNQNEDEASAEVDEQENAKTLARLLVTSERNMDKNFPNTHSNPLDRYTESQMPEIHERDPMTLLADLDSVQIQSWLDLPTGKVLARPFDQDVNYQPNHINIAKTLLTAAKEITGATTAAVAPPNRDKYAPRGRGHRHPITFLIHDISKKDAEFLLERQVWSSKEITFQVAPVNVKRPVFLFTLTEFTTNRPEHIAADLAEAWGDPITRTVTRFLASRAHGAEEQQNRLNQIHDFLSSRTTKHGWSSETTSEAAPTNRPCTATEKPKERNSPVVSATGATTPEAYANSHKFQDGTEEAEPRKETHPKELLPPERLNKTHTIRTIT
ncbi:hypothetical protein EDB85DRAFT_2137828 [Lactarius pseudohatsudake]|nr:hypothetical protein EDB85DRAFT_2137828 [Lactarius pseudohatsudake]